MSSVKKFRIRLGLSAVILGIALLVGALYRQLTTEPTLLSPLTPNVIFRFFEEEPVSESPKIIYGFLPYWNINELALQPELTHLAYFGLTVAGDGSILTKTEDGTEPGYARLNSDTVLTLFDQVDPQAQVEIVLIQFDNDDIVNLATSETAQDELIKNIDAIMLAYPISGVNIDIEYTGEVTPLLRQQFAQLVERISSHLHGKYQNTTVSIDMYASAATKNLIWDVPAIGRSVDYIVIMAYDFHRRSSVTAGPVAPLFGGKELWDSDISGQLRAFTRQVDRRKLLLGIPFYGYEWQTTTADSQAPTFPDSGRTASFTRVQKILAESAELQAEQKWNESALSPYITYIQDDEQYVLYYENSRSLSYKLDFVNQLDLGGIAIWALGYEGDSREYWEVIERKFRPNGSFSE